MQREEAIRTIQDLYPPDAPYEQTREVGRQIMQEVLAEQWRHLPTQVLITMAGRMRHKESMAYFENKKKDY